ncbi:MAG: hypothetical protein Q9218_008310, partial [Villophora microphyllina]
GKGGKGRKKGAEKGGKAGGKKNTVNLDDMLKDMPPQEREEIERAMKDVEGKTKGDERSEKEMGRLKERLKKKIEHQEL